MCGITGIIDFRASSSHGQLQSAVYEMTKTLCHRGPDDLRVFIREDLGLALGHTRLAIRDLSPSGSQPMVSSCGRYVIVYNGEIYSQRELAARLGARGRHLRGKSDTEVILEACAELGVEATVTHLIGMFAFAFMDLHAGQIWLVRDRLGIKPLYWRVHDNKLTFGSELKSLRASGQGGWELDRDAIAGFLRYNYVASPRTAFLDVWKLEPGVILTFDANGSHHEFKYWSPAEFAVPNEISTEEAVDELEYLLTDSVSRCLVADVPIGALLSGGIDSTLVSALMVETSSSTVQTFTIGFDSPQYNEADLARKVANHLGTEHHELTATPESVIKLVDEIPKYFDEPFADSSQLPTMLLAELTRREVKVVLTGDGGDESFAGYQRYVVTRNLAQRVDRLPRPIARAAGSLLGSLPGGLLAISASLVVPKHLQRAQMGTRLQELGKAMKNDSLESLYRGMLSHWREPGDLIKGAREPNRNILKSSLGSNMTDVLNELRLEDIAHYLPDDILTKVDRSTMRVGLEARVPILDHRVVEFALGLPIQVVVHREVPKWPLRQLVYRRVPMDLVDRPKMGFGVPLDDWLRGPLKAWASELLSEGALHETNLLEVPPVRSLWLGHLQGRNAGYLLWDVLVLQSWLLRNLP